MQAKSLGSTVRFTVALAALTLQASGCAIFAMRPVQDMSDTAAAMHAAREVQADTLAPELYREATEKWLNAKKDYKFKNFKLASDEALQARHLAERAEFEAIRNGGTRTSVDAPPDPFQRQDAAPTKYAPYAYPTPTGTPVEEYEAAKAQEEKEKSKASQNQNGTNNSNTPSLSTTNSQAPTPAPNTGTSTGVQTGGESHY